MKKILLLLAMAFIGSLSFARVLIQQDFEGAGLWYYYDHSCLTDKADVTETDFNSMTGFSFSALWEFDSDNIDSPFHIYTGLDAGLSMQGFPVVPVIGISHSIKEFSSLRLELEGSLELGPSLSPFGGCTFYEQLSAGVTLMAKNRRGLYANLSLTDINYPYLAIYPGQGTVASNMGFLGLKLSAGIRF